MQEGFRKAEAESQALLPHRDFCSLGQHLLSLLDQVMQAYVIPTPPPPPPPLPSILPF